MIALSLQSPHWLSDATDGQDDYCAHGHVELSIRDVDFLGVSDRSWTVSAAALHFLRSIFSDHAPDHRVSSNQFIPCCRFTVFETPDEEYSVETIGCPNGIDPVIRHRNGVVEIAVNEKSASCSEREWATAVLSFVESVEDFYARSPDKNNIEDAVERDGWRRFWEEWRELKERADRRASDV